MPRCLWLLPIAALAAWWPVAPYWKSDDFLALHYVAGPGTALRDFAGPQYGATDIWQFYRPLITLSLWFDRAVAGADPWFAHFSNALVHATNALLVGLIWLRFLRPGAACAAGLVWALQPALAGSVLWAAGRSDVHMTLWSLVSLWCLLRGVEGSRAGRWLGPVAFALALCSKEGAMALPPVCLLLAAAAQGPVGFRARLLAGVRHAAPHFLLLPAFLLFRKLVLGAAIGGYSGAALPPLASVPGFPVMVLRLLDPLTWTVAGAPALLVWLGAAPALIALCLWLRPGRRLGLLAALAMFLLASVPTAPFWVDPYNAHNLRYFYLPSVALAGLLAGAGRGVAALVLLALIPTLYAVRADYVAADRESAAMHGALLRSEAARRGGDLFVAGLPQVSSNGLVLQFRFGIDRLLEPPFAAGTARLYALRPLEPVGGAHQLWPPGTPFALPEGTTLQFDAPDALRPVAPALLPELPLEVEGGTDLTGDAIARLAERTLRIRIRTPGVRTEAYRVTVFTASGYLCSVVEDHAGPGESDGHLDLRTYFQTARWSRAAPQHMQFILPGLAIPATMDLDTGFPVLVEAGSAPGGVFDRSNPTGKGTLVSGDFVPSHRAARLLRFQLDRGYPASVRSVLGG